MNPTTTPVLLVVASAKIGDLPAIMASLSRHSDFESFYVVCPPQSVTPARQILSNEPFRTTVVDEEEVISGLNAAVISANLLPSVPGSASRSLGCWYYQQFLKMGFARMTSSDYYLVWDADTVLTRRISFFENGKVLLTASNEYHRDYFKTIRRILPDAAIPDRSHISQHVLVRTADMRQLIDELASHAQPWWKFVLSSMVGKSPQQFSEYETYAAYCLSRWPERYQSIWRRWFRSGTAYFGTDWRSADVSALADLYDFISFEGWDTAPKKRRRSRRRVMKERVAVWSERNLGWTWFPS